MKVELRLTHIPTKTIPTIKMKHTMYTQTTTVSTGARSTSPTRTETNMTDQQQTDQRLFVGTVVFQVTFLATVIREWTRGRGITETATEPSTQWLQTKQEIPTTTIMHIFVL